MAKTNAALGFTVTKDGDDENFETASRRSEIDGHKIERRDPHGFWWFVDTKDSPHLSGSFLTEDEVRKAIHRYNVS